MRAHDGRGPQTILSENILRSLDLSSPDEIIGYLSYTSNSVLLLVVTCHLSHTCIINQLLGKYLTVLEGSVWIEWNIF